MNENNKEDNKKNNKIYDIIIIGGGPAGCAAGIYASRSDLKTLIITKQRGGTINDATDVENYPGFISIKGPELGKKFIEHASYFGTEIVDAEVLGIKEENKKVIIETSNEKKYETKFLVLAFGMQRRKLNVPGEDKLLGKGVSYCATCDGFFFKDKITAVAGGGNAAMMAVIELAQHSKKVYMVVREPKLGGEPAWQDKVKANEKIEVLFNKEITEIKGENKVEKIILKSGEEIGVEGVFIEVGRIPKEELINIAGVETDKNGQIKVDASQKTSKDRIYAAGDITTNSNNVWQIVTAVSEGSLAAVSIFKRLS